MGKPGQSYVWLPARELIACRGERGEVKHLSTRRKRYSVSSGERKRMRLNRGCVIAGRCCILGVVGRCFLHAAACGVSDKAVV